MGADGLMAWESPVSEQTMSATLCLHWVRIGRHERTASGLNTGRPGSVGPVTPMRRHRTAISLQLSDCDCLLSTGSNIQFNEWHFASHHRQRQTAGIYRGG